jgi:hypothetical protein
MFEQGEDIWVSLGNANRGASSLGALYDKSTGNAEKLKLLKKICLDKENRRLLCLLQNYLKNEKKSLWDSFFCLFVDNFVDTSLVDYLSFGNQ